VKREIYFSPRSLDDLTSLAEYLDREWGKTVTDKFLDRVDDLLDLIGVYPDIYVAVNKKKRIHKCIINNNVTLYYRASKNEIELITFFHSHQNPSKLKRVL